MTSRLSRRSSQELQTEPQVVEEKVVHQDGTTQVKQYHKGRFLGKGGFARVYELVNVETKRVHASKVIPKSSLTKARSRQKLMSEIKIHRSLTHKHIVKFDHFFEDQENVYILLEMCSNQTLNELLRRRKRLTELEVQCYIIQSLKALKYLHSHRVIHRDLKLGNMFINDKMEIKLGDLGLATKLEFEGERKRTICGTPNYIAPEILDGKHGHSYEVDVWSLGVVIYTLLIGKPPFETSDVKTTYKRIRMNAYTFPDHVMISQEAKALITRILHSEPTSRPTLDDIMDHPFFHMNSIPKILPVSTLAIPPTSSYIKQFQKSTMDDPNQIYKLKPDIVSVRPSRSSSQPNFKPRESSGTKTQRNNIPSRQPDYRPSTDRESRTNRKTAAYSSYKPNSNDSGPKIWVQKWVDYSSKYGLGYALSNNSGGVYFNDSTKIISSPNGAKFQYIYRRQSTSEEIVETYNMGNFPQSLHKKTTLLQHFRNHLTSGSTKTQEMAENLVYVKKWIRTPHAILFRLSNKLVQVCFADHTELLLCSDTRIVNYVNKQGDITVYPLSSAMESSNVEMSKRLRYTKEILSNMLGTGARTPLTDRDNRR